MVTRSLLVDVHTHLYLPRYASLLRTRTSVPFIRSKKNGDRLIILEDEPSGGRPVGSQYWDRDEKLSFMDKHSIDISIVSTANPWLDFLSATDASIMASELNNDLEVYCSTGPSISDSPTLRRLYGMGLLPIVPGATVSQILGEIKHIASLSHLRGVIMGTQGLGRGLDDRDLEPVWESIANNNLVVFLHPHYGLASGSASLYGSSSNGHVLPLALGFPFETTIAITRLILSGALDRHHELKILLAHSGGALPQLSSRLASCIDHDPVVKNRLQHDVRWYLGKLYFDAVAYGSEELSFVSSTIDRAGRYESPKTNIPSSETNLPRGSSRMMFGTDHPFFPPINVDGYSEDAPAKWASVVENLKAIDGVADWSMEQKEAVRGSNALKLFGLI